MGEVAYLPGVEPLQRVLVAHMQGTEIDKETRGAIETESIAVEYFAVINELVPRATNMSKLLELLHVTDVLILEDTWFPSWFFSTIIMAIQSKDIIIDWSMERMEEIDKRRLLKK